MTMARNLGWTAALAATLAMFSAYGCGGKSYPVAEVDGVVLINGKPGNKISVQFIPDVFGDDSPPLSSGETDAEGHFTLHLLNRGGGAPQAGAVVGKHRIVLRDLQLAESATGKGVPIRLPASYTMAASTPLTREVKEGKQTIEIQVPPK